MSEPELEPNRTALVIVDMQKGIVGLPTSPYAGEEVLRNCVQLRAMARQVGILTVLVHVGGAADGADRLQQPADQPTQARDLPADWSEFVAELAPQSGDVSILKHQWGAFYGTDLDLQLRRRGIDTLIMTGIATEFGVESTARDAYERNYRQLFVTNAMTGLTRESHENALGRIFPRMGHVRDTAWTLEALGA